MPKATGPQEAAIQENSLVTELLARGAENAKVLRGFIGPARDKGSVTLHQSLDRLGDTVEIQRDDIVYAVDAPRSSLGAVILWVKNDAQLLVRRTHPESPGKARPTGVQEVTQGRLRMQMRPAWGGGVCTSVCEPCISWCDCSICQSLPAQ